MSDTNVLSFPSPATAQAQTGEQTAFRFALAVVATISEMTSRDALCVMRFWYDEGVLTADQYEALQQFYGIV